MVFISFTWMSIMLCASCLFYLQMVYTMLIRCINVQSAVHSQQCWFIVASNLKVVGRIINKYSVLRIVLSSYVCSWRNSKSNNLIKRWMDGRETETYPMKSKQSRWHSMNWLNHILSLRSLSITAIQRYYVIVWWKATIRQHYKHFHTIFYRQVDMIVERKVRWRIQTCAMCSHRGGYGAEDVRKRKSGVARKCITTLLYIYHVNRVSHLLFAVAIMRH